MAIDSQNIIRNPNLKPVENPPSKWNPAGFRALRDALKAPGIITIAPWSDAPEFTVTLDLSGIAALTLAGKMSNRMIVEKKKKINDVGERLNGLPEQEESEKTFEELEDAVHDATSSVLEYHDYVLGSMIIEPKYYMLDQLTDGIRPDDGLSVFDFDPEMRWAIIKVANGGAEEFQKFRADPIGYSLALSVESTEQVTSRINAATDNALVDTTAVQPGDLASGDRGRGRRSKKSDSSDEQPNSGETNETATPTDE
jgi:hypothetical protein